MNERFELEREIASGGMGRLYRARDRETGGWVAFKRLSDGGDDARFRREIEVLGALDHPAIVRYVAHGAGWLAMEWLDGEDLSARLLRAPLDAADATRLAERILQALAAAHAAGVIHRDVKPANVFLVGGETAAAKLLDFGVARVSGRARGATLTRTGQAVGTPGYLAPEQVRGERVDGRADLFALGCVLYECLSGHAPFVDDDPPAVLGRILLDEPPPLTGVPAALAELVARLLGKDPAARPAGAVQALALLHGEREPAAAPPATAALAEEVRALTDAGRADEAAAVLARASRLPGSEARASLADGAAALVELRARDAEAFTALALAGLPGDDSVETRRHRLRAVVAHAAGDPAARLTELEAAVALDPADAQLRVERAHALADAGALAAALASLASLGSEGGPGSQLARAKIHLHAGRLADAALALRGAPPSSPPRLVGRWAFFAARVALRAGRAAVAETDAARALATLAPFPVDERAARAVLAAALLRAGKQPEAFAHLPALATAGADAAEHEPFVLATLADLLLAAPDAPGAARARAAARAWVDARAARLAPAARPAFLALPDHARVC